MSTVKNRGKKIANLILSLFAVSIGMWLFLMQPPESAGPYVRFIDRIGTVSHEAGHLATSGYRVGFALNAEAGGYAHIANGNFFTLPAGYIGSAVIACLLLILINRIASPDFWALIIGLVLLWFTFNFAMPAKDGNLNSYLFGYSMATILIVLGFLNDGIRFLCKDESKPIRLWLLVIAIGAVTYTASTSEPITTGQKSLDFLLRNLFQIGLLAIMVILYLRKWSSKNILVPDKVNLLVLNILASSIFFRTMMHMLIWYKYGQGDNNDISVFAHMYFPFVDPQTMSLIWLILTAIFIGLPTLWLAFLAPLFKNKK